MPRCPRKLSKAKQFAKIEKISMFGTVASMAPIGLWMYANAYEKAATLLPVPEKSYDPVRYYLVCHSIELGLKAYLSIHGATMLQLSVNAYGHNLEKIFAAAELKGLSAQVILTLEQRAEVSKVALYYAGKVFEYPAIGEAVLCYPSLPKLEVLLEVAKVW